VNPLERRYRRLLRWYPPQYRMTYGDEMIGVLLAAAADGQVRPRLADTLDLVRSGLRARLRSVGTGTDPRWQDALALYSFVAPILVTAAILRASYFLYSLLWGGGPADGQLHPLHALYRAAPHLPFRPIAMAAAVLSLSCLLAPVILGLVGLRRTAIVVTTLVLGWVTAQASLGWQIQAPNTVAFLVMLAVEVAALISSGGPRRGVRLLTWRGLALTLPWLAGAVVAFLDAQTAEVHVGKTIVALVILAAAATLTSARARRVLLVFAIPVAPFIVALRPSQSPDSMYWAPAILAVITFFISRRSVHERIASLSDRAGAA
jgi:hypothetical protein